MRVLATLLVVVSLLLGTSCVRTVWVRKGKAPPGEVAAGKVQGIPFYVKVERLRQTTVYQKVWYEVTLEVHRVQPQKTGDAITHAKTEIESSTYRVPATGLDTVREQRKRLTAAKPPDSTTINEIRDKLAGASDGFDLAKLPTATVSNTLTPVTVVDYDHPYYINAPRQWFGSTSLTTKLAADGTLTESAATAESTVGEQLSSLVPLKEFLTRKLVPDEEAAPGDEQGVKTAGVEALPAASLQATISIAEKGYVYTFTRLFDDDPCAAGAADCTCGPIPFELNGNFTRTALGDPPAKKSDPRRTIAVSGTVELPKP